MLTVARSPDRRRMGIDDTEATDVYQNEQSSEIFNGIDLPAGVVRMPQLKLE